MSDPQKQLPIEDRAPVTVTTDESIGSPTSHAALKTLRRGSKYVSLLLLSTIASCSFGYLAAKEQVPTTLESPAVAKILLLFAILGVATAGDSSVVGTCSLAAR